MDTNYYNKAKMPKKIIMIAKNALNEDFDLSKAIAIR
jgi:hypothetical protein